MKLRRGDVLENKNTIMDRLNETDIAKYTIKDSVFTNLFQDKKYLIQLYKTIHPEDKDVTEAELIDEFHVLLNSEYSAKYLQQLWKKVRKQGGLCTGITQNVEDLLQNYTATTMLANSEFVVLLKQANTDSFKMAEVIGVSDAQLRFVTNSQSGMGLLKCGNVVIPFDNQIGKDTSLYKLYNTNIHEKIAEQRVKKIAVK